MKRSAQVALVLAAATGVGGTAYSMMPRDNCVRADGGAPLDPSAQACRSGSGSGSSSSYRSGRSIFGSSGSGNSASAAQGVSSAGASSSGTSSSGATTRGGFGGFFHSLGSHISMGG
jgi:hypothetical protein